MHLSKKTTIISLILITLIGLVVLGYFGFIKKDELNISYTPPVHQEKLQGEILELPEVDTSDWKVYRNEKYGYEIKYPKSWKLVHENILENVSLEPIKNSLPPVFVNIGWIGTKKEKRYLSEWPRVVLSGSMTIDDLSSGKYNSMILIDFTKNNNAFEIEWYDNERPNQKAYEMFLKILSTFRFYK